MSYDKPKVTIDLEEYNSLLKAKEEKYDPDEVATIAANIASQIGQGGHHNNVKTISDMLCQEVDYTVVVEQNFSSHTRNYLVAKVIKKPIK